MPQLSGRRAFRLLRELSTGLKDPMTQAYHAGEFVSLSFQEKLRRLGLTLAQVEEQAMVYCERQHRNRVRHKDPARLRWKAQQGYRRFHQGQTSSKEHSYALHF